MAEEVRSEQLMGEKWDRCLADGAIKAVTGAGVGVALSYILFKRRPWPVALGTGFGLGMAYSNCQHEFRNPYLLYGQKLKIVTNEENKS